MHEPAALLREILRLWPELDAVPSPRRRDLPREPTAEQRERRLQRWEDEQVDRRAGAIGRGASPAPADLEQVQTHLDLTNELCDLADRVAAKVQPAADPTQASWRYHVSLRKGVPSGPRVETTPLDPGRWTYTHAHGADWALRWLIGAAEDGVPSLVADDITTTARGVLRALEAAIDGQRTRSAGTCPVDGTRLTVAEGDEVITCTTCHTAYGRRQWLRLRAGFTPPQRTPRRPLKVNLRHPRR